MAQVAVIIVNYGTAKLALAAVESVLERDHGSHDVEIHLVDNASPDGDAAHITDTIAKRGWQGNVDFYPETENHGFGRGNNVVLKALAARAIPPDYVFLLNPDAQLKTETIAELITFLEDRPKVAVVGAGIDRPDNGPAVTAAFRFPNLISEFAAAARLGPISRLTQRWSVAIPPDAASQRVDWISGAAFLARLDVLEQVGFFDPDFFLYYEETELMHRLNRAGWEIWYCAEARIEHVAGAATGVHGQRRKPMPPYWFESWRMYFSKTRGRHWARLCAMSRMLGSAMHALVSKLRRREPLYAENFLSDFYRLALRPLFSKEGSQ